MVCEDIQKNIHMTEHILGMQYMTFIVIPNCISAVYHLIYFPILTAKWVVVEKVTADIRVEMIIFESLKRWQNMEE